jgi:predicted ATPase
MSLFVKIPAPLIDFINQHENDINIVIGENGSGKSTLLYEIAQRYLASGFGVIAIANTIHDKFRGRHKGLSTLKISEGKSIVKKTLIRCMADVSQRNPNRMSFIGNAMRYVGFSPYIGFNLNGLKYNAEKLVYNEDKAKEPLTNYQISEIIYCIENYRRQFQHSQKHPRIYFDSYRNSSDNEAYLINIFRYERILIKKKIISGIELFLYKGHNEVPVLNASSGELTQITSMLYIASMISNRCVILIDEPENSLHPKWQVEYVTRINELFYLYQPKVVIATHSPLIITGADQLSKSIRVFKGSQGEFSEKTNETENVEEIYQDYFDVTTPQNRFLSELIVKKMNDLAEHQISLQQFESEIKELQYNSYDENQKKVLDGIIEMGQQIAKVK